LCPDVRRIDELLVAAQKLRIKEQSLPPSSSSEKPSAADNGKALVKKQTKSQNFRKSSVAMENRPVAMETKPVAIATNRVQSDVSDNELFILRDGGKCLKLPHNYRHLKKQLKSLELLVTSSNDEPSNDVFVDTNEQQNIRYIELLMLRNELELIKEEYLSLSQDNHHPSTMQVIGKLQFLDESITKLLSCSKSTTLPPFELSHKSTRYSDVEDLKLSIDNNFISICLHEVIPSLHASSITPSHELHSSIVQCIQDIAGLNKTIFISIK
jgi:hypothetical protein